MEVTSLLCLFMVCNNLAVLPLNMVTIDYDLLGEN